MTYKMGSRRHHEKSRNGCAQCKRRRIKCDQQPPICSNCRKRQVKCEYKDMFGTPHLSGDFPGLDRSTDSEKQKVVFRIHPLSNISNETSSTANGSRAVMRGKRTTQIPRSSVGLKMPLSQYPDSSLQELELLHHYCTMTSGTFSKNLHSLRTWQQEIPRQAGHSPILRHNVISLAAMHLAYLNPATASKYTYQAAVYQSRAIKGARDCGFMIGGGLASNPGAGGESAMTSERFLVLIFSSGLVLIQELAALHLWYFPQARDKNKDKLDELIDRVLLIRSVVKLWEVGTGRFDVLTAGVFGSCAKAEASSPAYIDVQTVLYGIKVLNRTTTADKEEQSAYESAIEMLRACFEVAMADPPDWTSSLLWPHMVPELYMTLLKQRQPLAMVIIGYFCALLHHYPDGWWAREWPVQVFGSLFNTLDKEWHAALQWPAGRHKSTYI